MKARVRSQGRSGDAGTPAGTTRAEAERLAARLAAEVNGRNDTVRSLTFGITRYNCQQRRYNVHCYNVTTSTR